MLGTEAAYNLGIGGTGLITGKNFAERNDDGSFKEMSLLEAGARTTGGLFGARSVINAEIAAPNSAVNKLDDIFKNNTPKPQAEMVTPNGFRVKVPQTNKPFQTTEDLTLEARRLGNETFVKPINFPSSQKVKIDMQEIVSGHQVGGIRLQEGNKKSLFPADWSAEKIENAVREAYKNANKVLKRQITPEGHEKLYLEGSSKGWKIRFWYNKTTQKIETAFPNRADVK